MIHFKTTYRSTQLKHYRVSPTENLQKRKGGGQSRNSIMYVEAREDDPLLVEDSKAQEFKSRRKLK